MVNKTIIYYTANRESKALMSLVQETLIKATQGLPIISVSQKPIDFGDNICVGDVGFSSHNSVRQVLIGTVNAKTPYVALVEADCLYTKEHFDYVPRRDSLFFYDRNVWMLRRDGFIKRRQTCIGGIIVSREKIITAIRISLRKRDLWYRKDNKRNLPKAYRRHGWKSFRTQYPIVQIDHDDGLHPYETNVVEGEYFDELYPWGKARNILNKI